MTTCASISTRPPSRARSRKSPLKPKPEKKARPAEGTPMVLPIYLYGQKVLRKRAQEVGKVTPELTRLAEDMLETMYQSNGIGLAAPQVGHSIRLIVVDVAPSDEEAR